MLALGLRRLLLFLAVLPALPTFASTLSHAPVVDDPGLASPATAKLWPHIGLLEARKEWGRAGIVFLDGRSRAEWRQARISGAISLPGIEFENSFPQVKHRLIHAKAVIVYCHGYSCSVADYICRLLAGEGLRNMCVFSDGFPAWKAAGYPLEVGTPKRRKDR